MAVEFARPDFLVTTAGLKAVEINVSAPIGGMNTHDPYLRQFAGTAYGRYLAERRQAVGGPDMSSVWARAVLSLVRSTPSEGRPVMFEGLANQGDTNTGRRFFAALASIAGFDVRSGTMADLEVRAGGVFHAGRRIDVIFTMYTWAETRQHLPFALTKALMDLDEAGYVDFIAPPVSALYDSKVNLEILSSPRFSDYFGEDEQNLLRTYIPETFRLTPSQVRRAQDERTSLVLKPASEYGGRGVVFGHLTAADDWRAVLDGCLADRTRVHVSQRRVDDMRTHPCSDGDNVREYDLSLGPMVFGHRYAGTIVRAAPHTGRSRVLNVARGAEVASFLTPLQPSAVSEQV